MHEFVQENSEESLGIQEAVLKCLHQLGEDDRQVLLLVDHHGFSYLEAADVLDLTESALKSRLYRARQTFLKKYENPETF
jgi:RNA polymerase sigma-70 factor (ECF subfamily)